MKKVFITVTKDKKIVATGCIYVGEVGDDKLSDELMKEQGETNKVLYDLIKAEGVNLYKSGIANFVALAIRGYKVSFKEYVEKENVK